MKSQRNGTVVDGRASTLEESLRLFKDKSFEYLLESSYFTPYQKQEIRTRARAITGGGLTEPNGPTTGQQQQSTTYYVPKTESSNNYTVSASYTEANIIDGTIDPAEEGVKNIIPRI